MDQQDNPVIEVSKNGPYIVRDLKTLRNSKGIFIETSPVMALCRCGKSKKMPFCDGSHLKSDFSGEKKDDRVPDRIETFHGKNITIHSNRGVCSHIGYCVEMLPSVFRKGKEPRIDPDGADAEEIAKLIRMCPSGALSYTIGDVHYKDYPHEPEIFISKDSAYHVVGGIKLKDPAGSKPETEDHYTLCRCGASKNKPFCDGSHFEVGFKDPKN